MIFMGPVASFVVGGKARRAALLISTVAGRDGRAALVEFARRVGLPPSWLRDRQTANEHFELIGNKIDRAVALGVDRVDGKRFLAIVRDRGEQLGLVRVPMAVIRARTTVREAAARAARFKLE